MVALVADLLFVDRITRIGQKVGEEVTTYATIKEFREYVNREHPDMAVVDLSLLIGNDLSWFDEIPHVSGFGPHVDRQTFQMAKSAGIHPLWANSVLTQRLGPWIAAIRAKSSV
ncbi:MAG: hypothetical protein M1294_10215 [Firmicutes bacterium]|jgi:hypothetical protein|uniref:Response regulatory domain-containing protein n=1 Tax=Sulfobacillus benefaciens TaxID=453960 RepID=A0A2T2X764_9FIRM|nr:hypothetical protein [Bacillota bacterium]MCL5012672.1 hypothetical protein [Bacillota bacterium]PSR30307.1 MAG: hypothetical protein C7B43_06205 [Sulfobacillus benefaciens]HBQ94423.1 hypothetical protein [Sulfobacillus sp.]